MPEEKKPLPEGQESEVKVEPEKTESSKETTDAEKLKAADEKNTALEARLKDRDETIGRQSEEVKKARELSKTETRETLSDALSKVSDTEIREEAKALIKEQKMDEADAIFNAEVLIKRDRRKSEKETLDLIEEAIDEKVIDNKIFGENKEAIFSEFRGRIKSTNARKNLRIFKDCVADVTRRRADQMKEEGKKKDDATRDGLIDNADIELGGTKREEANKSADKKATDEIANAGARKNEVFF